MATLRVLCAQSRIGQWHARAPKAPMAARQSRGCARSAEAMELAAAVREALLRAQSASSCRRVTDEAVRLRLARANNEDAGLDRDAKCALRRPHHQYRQK